MVTNSNIKEEMDLHCKNVLCINRNVDVTILTRNKTVDCGLISKYSWAKEYSRDSCKSTFYVCSICNDQHQSRRLMIKSPLYRHAKIHLNTEMSSKQKSTPIVDVFEKKRKLLLYKTLKKTSLQIK